MSDWVETLGILIASGTAVWGILKWQLQMISQRKMELAEEVLSAFYEAEDVIRAARPDAILATLSRTAFHYLSSSASALLQFGQRTGPTGSRLASASPSSKTSASNL